MIGRVVYICIFCYIQLCAKSKFCAKRSRNYLYFYKQPLLLDFKPFSRASLYIYLHHCYYYIHIHIIIQYLFYIIYTIYINFIFKPLKIKFKPFYYFFDITCHPNIIFHFERSYFLIIFYFSLKYFPKFAKSQNSHI